MSSTELALRAVIIILAVAFAVFSGRARGRRLKNLHQDVAEGSVRGFAILFVVTIALLLSFLF